ncbi:MAG: NAD(P)/FAD-dependent oxidoreductase [Gemmatimonadaceae bacterium]
MPAIRSSDVCVVGAGIVGCCTALALAARGVRVDLVSRTLPGSASRAAAGLLAPSIEAGVGSAHDFAARARDFYPEFLARLESAVGVHVEFSSAGILRVALDEAEEAELRVLAENVGGRWLAPNEVRTLEPALAPSRGGVLLRNDGYADNVALMDALERAVAAEHAIRPVAGLVTRIAVAQDSATLTLSLGERLHAAAAVLAAGAWSGGIQGLPRPLAVTPLKGEMISYGTGSVQRAVYGAGVYLAPRSGRRLLVGATAEDTGFDVDLTDTAVQTLARGAKRLLPGLQSAEPEAHWLGLRPMTPDKLPLIGRDPEAVALIYATGHSRNGILKAPLTAEHVAALFVGETLPGDMRPFAPERAWLGAAGAGAGAAAAAAAAGNIGQKRIRRITF